MLSEATLPRVTYFFLLAVIINIFPIVQPAISTNAYLASNGVVLREELSSSSSTHPQRVGAETGGGGRSLLAGSADNHEDHSSSQSEHQNTANSSAGTREDRKLVLITAHQSRVEEVNPPAVESLHEDEAEETGVASANEHPAPQPAVVLITGANHSEIETVATSMEEQASDSQEKEEHDGEHGHEHSQDPPHSAGSPENSAPETEEVKEVGELEPPSVESRGTREVVLIVSAPESVQTGSTPANVTSSSSMAEGLTPGAEASYLRNASVPAPIAEENPSQDENRAGPRAKEEPQSPPQPIGSISIELHFTGMDYADVVKDTRTVQNLTDTVKISIADFVGINKSDVYIIDLLPGSIIIDVQVDLYDKGDVQKIENTLVSNPETVFDANPYGIPEVQITGGSLVSERFGGNNSEGLAIPATESEDLHEHEEAESVQSSPSPPAKKNQGKNSSGSGVPAAPWEETNTTKMFGSSGHVFCSLTFAWLDIQADVGRQERLKKTVLYAMANVNGSHLGFVEIQELFTHEKFTRVEAKVTMIGDLDVMGYVKLFDPLKMEQPSSTWVFGDVFVVGEFLSPTVEFREIVDGESPDYVSSGEAIHVVSWNTSTLLHTAS